MNATIELSNDPRDWIDALKSLVKTNLRILRKDSGTIPPIYKSGVKYRAEKGTERWSNLRTLLKQGHGDCEDLSSWRVAELLATGQDAKPWIVKTGRNRYHAVVKRSDGTIEDPTKIIKRLEKHTNRKRLGMNRTSKIIRFRVRRIPGGFEARLLIPVFSGRLSLSGVGPTKADAMALVAQYGLQAVQPQMQRFQQMLPFRLPGQMPTTKKGVVMTFADAMAMQSLQQLNARTFPGILPQGFAGSGMAPLLPFAAANPQAASLFDALPTAVPGAPPEVNAALIALKTAANLAKHPRVKRAGKKIWRKLKSKRLKKIFKLF